SKDGSEFVNTLAAAVSKWHDYSCDTNLVNCYPSKVTRSGGKFYYKDGQVRVEVKGGGYRDGSVVARCKDGSVFAKGGLALGFIKIKLDPDSRMLVLPDGDNVVKSALPDIMSEMKEQLAKGYTCRVSTKPAPAQGLDNPVYMVEEYEPAKSPAR